MSEIKSPSLSKDTFNYMQKKISAELAGSVGNVNKDAAILLSQALFKDGGCNYSHDTKVLRDAVFDMTHDAVVEEHKKLMKHGIIKVSVLSPSDEVLETLQKMKVEKFEPMKYHVVKNKPYIASTFNKAIPGKASCTVKWGHIIDNPSIASKLAIGVLGNGFSGRLMKKTAREW